MQQQSANDVRNLAYEDARRDVIQTQGEYRQRGEAANQGVYQAAEDRRLQKDMAADARTERIVGGVAQGVGTGVGLLVKSDIRAKKDIRSAGPEVDEAMDAMGDYRYRYRDQRDGRGTQVGPMAQELASTEAGRNAVARGPDDQLYIKGPQATGLALAGLARLNERLRAVEESGSGKAGTGIERLVPADARSRINRPDPIALSRSGISRIEEASGRDLQARVDASTLSKMNPDEQRAELQRLIATRSAEAESSGRNYYGERWPEVRDKRNREYVTELSRRGGPITLEEYEAVAAMPSYPEVDLFRQRPEFQGYGNVAHMAAPLPKLGPRMVDADVEPERFQGIARISPHRMIDADEDPAAYERVLRGSTAMRGPTGIGRMAR